MRLVLSVLALVVLTAACGDDNNSPQRPPEPGAAFEYRGLNGLTVVDLEQTADTLIAGTNDGIYKYIGEDDWTLVSPSGWNVLAITALYPSHLLASIQIQLGVFRLAESVNSGDDWTLIETDFGGSATGQTEPVLEIVFEEASGKLLATGYDVLAMSSDFGRSWSAVDGGWQRIATGTDALAYSSQHGDIWSGGQDALENAKLRRVDRHTGESSDLSDGVLEWLKRPSTIESITFYPHAEHIVFVSGEGGVLRSADYGSSWSPVLVNDTSRFYFDVVIDGDTGLAYTGGWDKDFVNPQTLVLEVSHDTGVTWQSHEYQDADILGGIWSLLLARFGGEKRLFVGLQGGGVYEVDMDAVGGVSR